MAITGVNGGVSSNYTNYYTTKNVGNTKDNSNVSTSTVELKTSTGGTRTEQIKTGYSNVNDYSQYLQGKYSYMNTGTTSMQGVPTTVSVSSAFLQKCMNDPEKAKYLEENLAAIPDCVKSAVNGCLGTLTNLSYKIDADGNITITGSGTNDPDGKIARENAERKAKESREKEKKAEEKRTAKRAEEKKAAEKAEEKRLEEQQAEKEAAEKMTTVYVTGTSMKDVTEKVISGLSNTSTIPNGGTVVVGFDVKA